MSEIFRHPDEDNELDALPPELVTLHRKLIADSERWQRHLPPAGNLAQFARATPTQTAALRHSTPHGAPLRQRNNSQPLKGQISMSHPRARVIVPVVVAVMVVALLAFTFTQFKVGHSSHGQPGAAANAGHDKDWVTLPKLGLTTEFGNPIIAPTDPQVVYEVQAGPSLRRTDDGGNTWHALPLPVAVGHNSFLAVFASPLDAHSVYLHLRDTATQDCAPSQVRTTDGGETATAPFCSLNYFSEDGGMHWVALQLPPNTTLAYGEPFFAQSSRLFANVQSDCSAGADICNRIAASADGVTWHLVDDGLLAAGGQWICDFTVSPQGNALFAVTTADGVCARYSQHPQTLWRSVDGGAHWSRVTVLPTVNDFGITALSDSTLYGYFPKTTAVGTNQSGLPHVTFSEAPNDIMISTDAGVTWQSAPIQGVPADQAVLQVIGTLKDGAVLIKTQPRNADPSDQSLRMYGPTTLFAWKPGDGAWHHIATTLTGVVDAVVVTPSTATPQGTIWLIMRASLTSYTYDVLRFTA